MYTMSISTFFLYIIATISFTNKNVWQTYLKLNFQEKMYFYLNTN